MSEAVRLDIAARAAALEPGKSILLQAPAGSGKTTVLTQRFLKLLSCVAEPEEILAITFTRKAAAEMRARVLDALEGRVSERDPTRELLLQLRAEALRHAALRGWEPHELPARLRIQTIDSLNHEFARSMPVLGRAAGSLEVIDQADLLYRRAARQTLIDAESDPEFQPDMDLLFRRLDNDWSKLQRLLAEMLARRAQWLPPLLDRPEAALAEWIEESLAGIISDALARASHCLDDALLDEGAALSRAASVHRLALGHEPGDWEVWLEADAALGAEPAHLPAWTSLARLALTEQEKTWRRAINKTFGFPPGADALKDRLREWIARLESVPGAHACLSGVLLLPPALLDAADKAALAALARLLKLAASELVLQFQIAGRVDHSEVAAVARQALETFGEPSDFAIRQTMVLQHLLVDEFQDTSIEQFGLLEALVVGWQPGDGRSLFLVGDPMQSIYLFRSAEVGLFLRAKQQGIGTIHLEYLQLTRNFRSAPAIVDWVNTGFTAVFPEQEDLRSSAVSFLKSSAARDDLLHPQHGVTFRSLAADDRGLEAQQIALTIIAARARNPEATVAVLVQSRNHSPAIMQALAQRGIATRGIDLAPLAMEPCVGDLISLTRALLHGADRSAWLAVLRAPWCGLLLRDLHCLFDVGQSRGDELVRLVPETLREPAPATLTQDGLERLGRCAPLLLQAYDERARGDLATAVERLWLQLGGPATCANERELLYCREYLEKLRDLDATGEPLDAALVEAMVKDLKTGGEGDAGAAIDILTIHKAKGLEWDVVIVPGIGRLARSGDSPLLRWLQLPRRGGDNDLLMATMRIGADSRDPLDAYIKHLQKQREGNERMRLAYVAMTRARRELHLFGHATWEEDAALPSVRKGSLLHTLWPAVADLWARPEADAGGAASEEAAANLFNLARLPQGWQMPATPVPIDWHSIDAGAAEPTLQPEYSWVGAGARAMGTVVHAELERLAREGATQPAPGARLDTYRIWLRQLGVATASIDSAARRVASLLERALADPRARWLLDSGHRDASSELRVTGVVDGRLRNVIIDRTFIDEAGDRWVVDYKTSGHEGGDLEGFLQQELERYRSQLEQYRSLAAQLGPEPVRTALYFPLLGEFRELPPGSLAAE